MTSIFKQPGYHNTLKILYLKFIYSSENPRVGSSILSLGTINSKAYCINGRLLLF